MKANPSQMQIQRMREGGNDTIVQCGKCKRTQYLRFANGLKNGWSKCCGGLTMPIVYQEANIENAVKETIANATLEVRVKETDK